MSNTMQDDAAPVPSVHVGHSGFLFLSGGNHSVFSYFTGDRDPVAGSTDRFAKNVLSRNAYCVDTGRIYKMVVFPEKCVALRDKIKEPGEFQPLYHRHYAKTVHTAGADPFVVYPLEPLLENEDAFFRTDTHYSGVGCLRILEEILKDIFPDCLEQGRDAIAPNIQMQSGFVGDLGRKFTPPLSEEAPVLRGMVVPYQLVTNGMKAGNDGICTLVSSPESLTDKTLLIFGDSFFRQLLPMLAVFYRKIIFCRTRFFHYEIVEAFAPDHVFGGMAERYLSASQDDAERPHFLSYPLLSGRALAPDAGFADLWTAFCDQRKLVG